MAHADLEPKLADSLTVTSLVQELEKNLECLTVELKTYLSTSMETSLMPLQSSLDTINASLDLHNQKINAIENTLTDHSDELVWLKTQLEKANTILTFKAEDLENRSRRQNVRIVGIPEGAEGGSPIEFVSQLLHKVIGNKIFPKLSKLDRAHRTHIPKPT